VSVRGSLTKKLIQRLGLDEVASRGVQPGCERALELPDDRYRGPRYAHAWISVGSMDVWRGWIYGMQNRVVNLGM